MAADAALTGHLGHEAGPSGVRFRVDDSRGVPLPVEDWGRATIRTAAGPGSVAHLLALLEDDAVAREGEQLLLRHGQIAQLDAAKLRQIGLPPPAPVRLELQGSGLLASPGFRFLFRLLGSDGRPLLGTVRHGVFLDSGRSRYTLLDPLYSLVEGIEHFNALPPTDIDGRFLAWADLKTLLPDDAVVDSHLREMSIVRADAVTLDQAAGGAVYPVLLSRVRAAAEDAPDTTTPATRESLPAAAQDVFNHQFTRLSRAQARYALAGGWYVALGESVRHVLGVVREFQDRPAAEQRALLNNPAGVLKDRLAGVLDDDAIDSVFEETPRYLSARVRGLGEWEPKLCAYVIPRGQSWLPPEATLLAVPVGDAVLQVAVADIPDAIAAVQAALAAGQATVDVAGQTIAASDATLAALRRLGGSPTRGGDEDAPETGAAAPEKLVPLILDNIESLDYAAPAQPRPGEAGNLPGVLSRVTLLEHQRDGLRWLQDHWVTGSRGALLADDMGLGKTLQALAFLAWLREQIATTGARRPILVVAPTGLLRNWEDEATTHLDEPRMGPIVRAYGPELSALARTRASERIDRLSGAGWVMTTYETLRDRIEAFLDVDWAVVVFDEAQKIKNPAARMTDMAKSLKVEFGLAMTGTPVENCLGDLWSIADAVNPGLLGSLKEFHNQYEKPAVADPAAAAPLTAKLTEETKPAFMLRRLKEDHLKGLPEKRIVVHEEVMPAAQAVAYGAIVQQGAASAGERGAMLGILQNLRKASLIADDPGPEGLTDAFVATSARLRTLTQVLDQLRDTGEKALVFVEFLDMQELLIPYLQRRYALPRPPLRISGEVSGALRKSRVDQFQKGPAGEFDVMLLSPKAGGVGLTLTAANHVIHLTRWWNPAVEDQCTDRVYRIGQKRPVTVHLPLAIHPEFPDHSFDRNLHALLEGKRTLSRSVLAPPSASDNDIANLFASSVSFGKPTP